jgi:hypothetical protein
MQAGEAAMTNALLGAWRLVSLTLQGRDVGTTQTHLVVREDLLWEVHPSRTLYEGELGPESRYRVSKTDDMRLEIFQPPRPSLCAIARISGDELRVRWGSMLGRFPRSLDDEGGLLAVLTRESDAAALARAYEAPVRVKRVRRKHSALGVLSYDDDLKRWSGKARWTTKSVIVHVSGPKECGDDCFDRAALRLKAVRCDAAKAYASTKLLELKNDTWLSDGEKPMTASAFRARLVPESFSVDTKGRVSVCFHDGGLFWGHAVMVDFDAKLRPIDAQLAG